MTTPVATKLLNDVCQGFYKAAESNLKLHQDMLRAYTRMWPGFTGRLGSNGESFEEFQQQWVQTLKGVAQTQSQLWQDQLRAALGMYDAVVDVAMPKASPPVAEKPAGVTAPVKVPVVAPPQEKAVVPPQPPAPQEPFVAPPQVLPDLQQRVAKNIYQKVAVVTGAASGIGEAVVRELVHRGVKGVLLVDRSEAVRELAGELNKAAGRPVALPMMGDTTDEAFRKRVFHEAMEKYGPVTICVPAAGITRDGLAVRVNSETGKAEIYPLDTFRQVTEVNLLAPIYWGIEMVARIAEDRRQRGLKRWEPEESIQGTVVFLGSVSSQGNKGQISYAVAKAGLEGATATLTKEAIYHGVRCAIIHPGFTDTPMARALGEEFLQKNVLPYTQLRRLIQPEEIADAICFMISNAAVSGELWADAGWHPPA